MVREVEVEEEEEEVKDGDGSAKLKILAYKPPHIKLKIDLDALS